MNAAIDVEHIRSLVQERQQRVLDVVAARWNCTPARLSDQGWKGIYALTRPNDFGDDLMPMGKAFAWIGHVVAPWSDDAVLKVPTLAWSVLRNWTRLRIPAFVVIGAGDGRIMYCKVSEQQPTALDPETFTQLAQVDAA